jgi:integrase
LKRSAGSHPGLRDLWPECAEKDAGELWNTDFIFKAVENPGKPYQPVATSAQVNSILGNRELKARDRVFVALAASTGLRIGELLAIRIGKAPGTCWDGSMIRVRESIWRGKPQAPKTPAAIREVDLPLQVEGMLEEFTFGRKPGEFLFNTSNGNAIDPSYVATKILTPVGIPGAHSLRRLRVSHLREVGCNESILRFWIGHSGKTITDGYDKLARDVELRRREAERCGTGLDIAA